MTKQEQQDIYNSAFNTVLTISLVSIIFYLFGPFVSGVYDTGFIILFLLLGYLVKRRVRNTPLLLLVMFSINIVIRVITLLLYILSIYPDTSKAQGVLNTTLIPGLVTIYVFKILFKAYKASHSHTDK